MSIGPHSYRTTVLRTQVMHFTTTILLRQKLLNRPFLTITAITEIVELAQGDTEGSHSADYTRSFRVSPAQTAYQRACSVLSMLMPPLRDAVQQFVNPFILG